MNTDPREIVQACNRVQEVLQAEFGHLSPADCVFVLESLRNEYIISFREIIRSKGLA